MAQLILTLTCLLVDVMIQFVLILMIKIQDWSIKMYIFYIHFKQINIMSTLPCQSYLSTNQ